MPLSLKGSMYTDGDSRRAAALLLLVKQCKHREVCNECRNGCNGLVTPAALACINKPE